MGALARKLGGRLDQVGSELPEIVEVLACPQQAEDRADHGGVSDRKGLADAPYDLSVLVVIARRRRGIAVRSTRASARLTYHERSASTSVTRAPAQWSMRGPPAGAGVSVDNE
jgi:hypothetical protein